MTIYFDMDGTIANLYADPNWLAKLRAYDPSPYANAKPLVNMSLLARYIHNVQKLGYSVGIISWLSKEPTDEYDRAVTNAKLRWLTKHLPSVEWDEIHIIAYGTPKSTCGNGILFDDELNNRNEWGEGAFEPCRIMEILRGL